MPRPKSLNFITSNPHKLSEVRAILSDVPDLTLTNKSVDLPELQDSIEGVSKAKAIAAADVVQGPVLVEDTCLIFEAWGELPGPYIKHFWTQFGARGMHTLLGGFEDKSAQAICTFAYCAGPGEEVLLFQGRTKGKIVPARGPTDFGWDAAFEYEGQTYAEMPKDEKNKISHRGKALAKLKEWLAQSVASD